MKAFYCPGTHWDREWYEPFQEFRIWLVELIDELLDLLEARPEYRCFHLDGQTILLADYLEVRPEQRERLLRMLRERRLLAGPWYNLPDEWLVSGESLIRNLQRGLRDCRELGFPAMNFAYTPDQFGHIAALPMIMRGFGFPMGIVWRGTQDENFPAQFLWRGPDGGEMLYHKLADGGSYAPFRFFLRDKLKAAGYTPESVRAHFPGYFEMERNRAPRPAILMLDALDHQRPDPHMPEVLDQLAAEHPDIGFVWGSLEDYAAEALSHGAPVPSFTGELREPSRDGRRHGQYLIAHTLSSRYPLKQANDRCQALLEKTVEPLLALMRMDGRPLPPPALLDKAWEWLLKNHPHDSICGCSVDAVHRGMDFRFDQCAQIGDALARRAMAALAAAPEDPAPHWDTLAVHNPLPFPRREVVALDLLFPPDWGRETGCAFRDALWHGEMRNTFHLEDAEGQRVPYQLLRIDRGREGHRLNAAGRRVVAQADVYRVAAELALPPSGRLSLRIRGVNGAVRDASGMRTGPLAADNGKIAFSLESDGTGTLRCHASGAVYRGLFQYESSGDGGDGWCRGPLAADLCCIGAGQPEMMAVEADGPLRTVFRVERRLTLPEAMDQQDWRRGAARVELRITDWFTLDKHAETLRVRTRVLNTARDHRMRVLLPAGIPAAHSFACTPFAFVERAVEAPDESAEFFERVNPEKPFTGCFGVAGPEGGLAVLAPAGLHEYAVEPALGHALALTLFRSVYKTVFQPEESEGCLLGPLEFEYALYPFAGPFPRAHALRLTDRLQTPPLAHVSSECVPEKRYFALESDGLVLSALKPADADDGVIVRLWNPNPEDGAAKLHFLRPPSSLERCSLREEPGTPLQLDPGGGITITAPAGGIVTLRCRWS